MYSDAAGTKDTFKIGGFISGLNYKKIKLWSNFDAFPECLQTKPRNLDASFKE